MALVGFKVPRGHKPRINNKKACERNVKVGSLSHQTITCTYVYMYAPIVYCACVLCVYVCVHVCPSIVRVRMCTCMSVYCACTHVYIYVCLLCVYACVHLWPSIVRVRIVYIYGCLLCVDACVHVCLSIVPVRMRTCMSIVRVPMCI